MGTAAIPNLFFSLPVSNICQCCSQRAPDPFCSDRTVPESVLGPHAQSKNNPVNNTLAKKMSKILV